MIKSIFAFPFCYHDHNYYDGQTHIQEERFSRIKHNIIEDPVKPRCLEFCNKYLHLHENYDIIATTATSQFHNNFDTEYNNKMREFMNFKPKYLWDFKKYKKLYYIDHHQSHAAYAFLTSGYKESDILAIDGSGRQFRTIFIQKDEKIIDLSNELSIGKLWELISRCSTFGRFSEGKLMGASAIGTFSNSYYKKLEYIIQDKLLNNFEKMSRKYFPNGLSEEEAINYSTTLQQFMIDKIFEYILPLKSSINICVAGGVAYNGYLNEELTKYWKGVHIPPAPGDEGQALGCYMHCNFTQNNIVRKLSAYNGTNYDLTELDKLDNSELIIQKSNNLYKEVAQEIANGKIIGWFQGRSESGNRALGNRSILADPRNPNIKNIINHNIKLREDFRPFAPSILEEHYKEYFNTNLCSPYMSRIVKTTNKAKKEIPGVIHIDGTSRFQSVNINQNKSFYKLIKAFYDLTGVPVLLNTSFNCHEPIIETVEDAINTFRKTNLDFIIIGEYICRKK